jgi:hypothetical protein
MELAMTASTIATHLHAILLRDLRGLRREVEAYPDDDAVWALAPGIANSCGTLVLHLAGNLRLYAGHVIGGIAYERDRPREFAPQPAARGVAARTRRHHRRRGPGAAAGH